GSKAQSQGEAQSGRDRGDWSFFIARFAHIHHDDDAKVVISRYPAINYANDNQSDERVMSLQRRTEHIKLGEEPASDGNAYQRQQKDSQDCGEYWRPLSQTLIIFHCDKSLARSGKMSDHRERAYIHGCVLRGIEHRGWNSVRMQGS